MTWPVDLPKIALCGPGECGKDVCATWLAAHTPLRMTGGTSRVIAPFIAAEDGVTADRAYANRRSDRDRWARMGDRLCADDPAFLVRECLRNGEIVVGIRRLEEFRAVHREHLIELAIWIDRPDRHDSTMQYGPEMCDFVLQNHGDLEDLYGRLEALARFAGLLI